MRSLQAGPTCPSCQQPIEADDINVRTDVARCRGCGALHRVSALLESIEEGSPVGPLKAPPGAEFTRGGSGWVLSATTRSPIAFFLVPFMLVWSGGSLGGIYGSQIATGEFNPLMSAFGIPFLAGSVLFWAIALMAVAGRVEVRGMGDRGEVFTGIGPIGRTQPFLWSEIERVSEAANRVRYPGSHENGLVLEGARRVAFGSGLSEERRYFLLHKLREILRERKGRY